ncbi:secretory calcium-binding phosphoprotein 5 [Hemibagrus wyckioides]|uniref:secretory calcium-binding phosphoprotein 5 n=1 Tax=Hemibagrus wyckioides TaxID=337641 RepID=UPI00266C2508|nr:secretory calcium-binding phosphoprotein 5 [Hemibagrus wyckioides]
MSSAVFFFSFISAVTAAPLSTFYSFLPHYGNPMPSGPSNQAANDMFSPSHLQAGMTTPISMEILLPPRFTGAAGGQGAGAGTNSMFPGVPAHLQPGVNTPISIEILVIQSGNPKVVLWREIFSDFCLFFIPQGFIKYSLPKAPGRKSVEIYYPYNFGTGEVLPNVLPQIPNIFPFSYPPQTGPQQQPPRQAAPPPQANDQPFVFNYPQTGPQQQPPRVADPQQQIQQDPQVPAGQVPTQP